MSNSRLKYLPFWAFLWPGAYGLTRYIESNPNLFQNSLIFDLGCGCGISSIGALKANATFVISNDIDPFSILASSLNIYTAYSQTKYEVNVPSRLKNEISKPLLCSDDDFLQLSGIDFDKEVCTIVNHNLTALNSGKYSRKILLVGDMLYDCEIGDKVLLLVEQLIKLDWTIYVGDPNRWYSKHENNKQRYGDLVGQYVLPAFIQQENHGLTNTYVYKLCSNNS